MEAKEVKLLFALCVTWEHLFARLRDDVFSSNPMKFIHPEEYDELERARMRVVDLVTKLAPIAGADMSKKLKYADVVLPVLEGLVEQYVKDERSDATKLQDHQ